MDTYTEDLGPRFAQLLADREAQLRNRLHPLLNAEVQEPGPRQVVDFKDMASDQALAEVDDEQEEHVARELGQVQAALRRLRARRYGRCLDCGEFIDLHRLLAQPAVGFCLPCQTAHEQARR